MFIISLSFLTYIISTFVNLFISSIISIYITYHNITLINLSISLLFSTTSFTLSSTTSHNLHLTYYLHLYTHLLLSYLFIIALVIVQCAHFIILVYYTLVLTYIMWNCHYILIEPIEGISSILLSRELMTLIVIEGHILIFSFFIITYSNYCFPISLIT